MRRIFHDRSLQEHFDRKGYVASEFLEPAAVRQLLDSYERLRPQWSRGFHSDMFSPDREYRKAAWESIGLVIGDRISSFLVDFKLCLANYIVKEPEAPDSEVPLHQDWTMVDDSTYESVNVFVPLVDVDLENGCLQFVPGSHSPPLRLSVAPFDLVPIQGVLTLVREKYLRSVPLKAGQCCFYHGRIIHGSPPNRTAIRRVAVGCLLLPREADLLLYVKAPDAPGKAEILRVEEDFFWSYNLGATPRSSGSLGFIDYSNEQITEEQLAAWSAR